MRVGSRDSYFCFTFDDVLHYMTWDLNFNTCFLAPLLVFKQVTGTAIGSSCTAQVASIVLIFRERTRALPSILEHTLWVRYRDNFLVRVALSCESERDVEIDKMFEAFRQMTGMDVTLEQASRSIEFLECTLNDPSGDCCVSVKNLLSCDTKSTPSQTRKMLSTMARNAPSALQSMVPNDVKECQHLRLTPSGVRKNLKTCQALYKAMGYLQAWWEPLFRKCCLKWGLPVDNG